MKKIVIILKNGEKIEHKDTDKTDRFEYSKKVCELMDSLNVFVLDTNGKSSILRGSDISAISIIEEVSIEKVQKPEIPGEDMIMDGD